MAQQAVSVWCGPPCPPATSWQAGGAGVAGCYSCPLLAALAAHTQQIRACRTAGAASHTAAHLTHNGMSRFLSLVCPAWQMEYVDEEDVPFDEEDMEDIAGV